MLDNHQNNQTNDFLYQEEGYKILGACFNVYTELSNGYLESVYQECLALEFAHNDIPFIQHPKLQITYKGSLIDQYYVPDFICYGKIILELKTVNKLSNEHRSQMYNYLKIVDYKVGYLINFGHYPFLEKERIAKFK